MYQVKRKFLKFLTIVIFAIFTFYVGETIATARRANMIDSSDFSGVQYLTEDEKSTVLFNTDAVTGTVYIDQKEPISFSFDFVVEYGLITFVNHINEETFNGLVLNSGDSIFLQKYSIYFMRINDEVIF